jgi:hypothetical protein
VSQFKYLRTTVTNQNLIQDEIKKGLNSDNHSVQNILSSLLQSKNVKIRLCTTIILTVVLYGFKTLFLTLKEKFTSGLGVFVNRVLRRIFEPKRN